ncbi:MAG: DUF4114 domain-containing protein [Taibaiella sp.]|nr:DUF4114 domain-containing protein [Taibaiella sp.]
MKKTYFLVALLTVLAFNTSNAQNWKYKYHFDLSGISLTPLLKDTIGSAFYSRILTSLPEFISVPVYHPEYLRDTNSDLKLVDSADVWITFVYEGASYLNALGFYTYNTTSPLTAAPADSDITIIFPNCSLPGSGGGLDSGDKVYLGKFPGNTGLGWVCVADGFKNVADSVSFGKWLLYSDRRFNPEADSELKQHTVVLLDTIKKKIVLGFEDNRRDHSDCDNDFNDIIFYLTAEPFTSVDTTTMPVTTCPGGSTSGGGHGGLESHSLGDAVSKRTFEKIKNSENKQVDYNTLPLFAPITATNSRLARKSGVSSLTPFMPATLQKGDVAYVTTPTDILSYTDAKDALSVDYTNGDFNKGVVLGIQTVNKAYSHTKSICDRFRGASLLGVDTINIDGYSFSRFTLQRENGNMEYSISFVVGSSKNRSNYTLQSNWLISQYANDDSLFNFQVWAAEPYYSAILVDSIIKKVTAIKPLIELHSGALEPAAYIIAGKRNKASLDIAVANTTNIHSARLQFDARANENSGIATIDYPLTVTNGRVNNISIPVFDGYEYQGRLYLNDTLVDEVYMADGNWNLDYDHSQTTINKYEITNDSSRVYSNNELPQYRDVTISATTPDYVSLYKEVVSGGGALDLTTFNTIKFAGSGPGLMQITMVKDSITDFKKQYSTTIALSPQGGTYVVSMKDFTTPGSSKAFVPNDVTHIIFTYASPGGTRSNVDFSIKNLVFSKDNALSTNQLNSKSVIVYPYPNNGTFTCQFASTKDMPMTINFSDLSGKVVYSQIIQAVTGSNSIQVSLPSMLTHTSLILTVEGDNMQYNGVKLLYSK